MIIEVYADASTMPKNPGHIGVGAAMRYGDHLVFGGAYAGKGTSNVGELLAIAFALDFLDPEVLDDVCVHTDSMYAHKVVTGEWPSGKNRVLVDRINKKMDMCGTEVILVPGHSGVELNEAADFLARQYALKGILDRWSPVYYPQQWDDLFIPFSQSDVLPFRRRLSAGESEAFGEVQDKIRKHQSLSNKDRQTIKRAAECLRAGR